MKNILPFLLFALLIQQAPAQIDFSMKKQLQSELLEEMDSLLLAGDYEEITSVLVAQNGHLCYEKYYQETDSTAQHNTRSATKSIATLLAGIAIDQGYIQSEKDKINTYLRPKKPIQNPDKRKEAITLEDLLTMSSVLECDDWNEQSRGHEMRMYFIEDWTQFLLDLPVRAYPFGPKPADRPYGRAFAYASAKAAAVGDLIERAVGMKLDRFAQKNLFAPLGIKDYSLDYTPLGVLNTAGGSEYRSRDFLKMIQLCLNQGKWNQQQLIPADWLGKATTPKAHAYDEFDYGYFFWLGKYGPGEGYDAFYMAGNGGNKIMALPALNLSIVVTSTNYNNRQAHKYSDELISKYLIPAATEK